ncbi:MAG: glycosyltransferase family 2 protein, partial [Betaproteobacteria bacterium]|nr:glycosyltransferase family 2 protein [Betaproteobacteria bacterium]
MSRPEISLSLVSHGHVAEVRNLLSDLERLAPGGIEVLLTLNSSADASLRNALAGQAGRVIVNPAPRGFGANHNAAFRASNGVYFCVINPDIRLAANAFPALLAALRDERVGIAGPRVFDSQGLAQRNFRKVPTPARLFKRALSGEDDYDYEHPVAGEVEWLAGMFMLFRRDLFESLGGFDERYFLYYEDVDICCRARLAGWKVWLEPAASVVHDARWASHHNPKFALWHARSLLRF